MVSASNLTHILLCAGSVAEWADTTAAAWQARVALVARAAHAGGASWATIVPIGGSDVVLSDKVRDRLVRDCGWMRYADRVVAQSDDGVTVIVDPLADGRERIANAAARLGQGGMTEQLMSSALSAPAPGDPDLVVVLGNATLLPESLVWELAYAEIVFLDAPWVALDAEHLEMAIDDFRRRDRRFGGVDS